MAAMAQDLNISVDTGDSSDVMMTWAPEPDETGGSPSDGCVPSSSEPLLLTGVQAQATETCSGAKSQDPRADEEYDPSAPSVASVVVATSHIEAQTPADNPDAVFNEDPVRRSRRLAAKTVTEQRKRKRSPVSPDVRPGRGRSPWPREKQRRSSSSSSSDSSHRGTTRRRSRSRSRPRRRSRSRSPRRRRSRSRSPRRDCNYRGIERYDRRRGNQGRRPQGQNHNQRQNYNPGSGAQRQRQGPNGMAVYQEILQSLADDMTQVKAMVGDLLGHTLGLERKRVHAQRAHARQQMHKEAPETRVNMGAVQYQY